MDVLRPRGYDRHRAIVTIETDRFLLCVEVRWITCMEAKLVTFSVGAPRPKKFEPSRAKLNDEPQEGKDAVNLVSEKKGPTINAGGSSPM